MTYHERAPSTIRAPPRFKQGRRIQLRLDGSGDWLVPVRPRPGIIFSRSWTDAPLGRPFAARLLSQRSLEFLERNGRE